jgi:hypothetical protein
MQSLMGIRRAYSPAVDARQAAQEFYRDVAQPQMGLVLFFCSSDYDLDALATELNALFSGIRVVGCTSAGEIGPGGYLERGIAGVSFSSEVCTAVSGSLDRLQQFEIAAGHAFGKRLLHELKQSAETSTEQNTFALLLIDGLSLREERVARTLQEALGKVPVAGGSAGDGIRFRQTSVFVDGSFRSDRAALTLVTTPLPFTVFKTQHFVATEQRLVITEAVTDQRVVKEINGMPAAEEYARLLGVSERALTPSRFAASPVVVLIDGSNYVRSIQKANTDGSITLYCAIDEGVVLRVAHGVDIVENLETALASIHTQIGPPQLLIACDCILRRLEIVQKQLEDRVGTILNRSNAVGFNTYGEQFRGVHVNQTLSGIAIGAPPVEASNV